VVAAISLRRYSAISLAEARKTRKALGPPRSLHWAGHHRPEHTTSSTQGGRRRECDWNPTFS